VFVRVCTVALLCLLLTIPGAAQSRQAGGAALASGGPSEAAALGRAWALMSQGSYSAASAQAQELLRRNPRSVNALALAVEAAIGLQGPAAGLDQYERWLGSRSLEEPGVLRGISSALLRELARNPATRLAALQGLAGDGDESAAAEIAALARQGGASELKAMARLGDRGAARALVAQLDRRDVDPARTIEAIGESGYAPAVDALAVWLGDQRPEVRGAAADALGKLGEQSPAVVKMLTPLLSDGSSYVRTRAAAALYRLGDPAGTPWLQALAASETPAGRMVAAEAMASRPDAAWTALVTELAAAGGAPDIRLRAARLLAPHNPDLAMSVARELSGDANLAIRELAGSVMSEVVSEEGLATLRGQLRAASDLTRLHAATRILDLTR
jgi:hypothetical protein